MGVLDRLLPITRVKGESGLVSINNKSLLFLPLFLSLPLRLLRTLASAFREKKITRDVSHETKIKLMTINRL